MTETARSSPSVGPMTLEAPLVEAEVLEIPKLRCRSLAPSPHVFPRSEGLDHVEATAEVQLLENQVDVVLHRLRL